MNLQRCYVVETYPLTTVLGTGALFSSRWIPFLPIVGRGSSSGGLANKKNTVPRRKGSKDARRQIKVRLDSSRSATPSYRLTASRAVQHEHLHVAVRPCRGESLATQPPSLASCWPSHTHTAALFFKNTPPSSMRSLFSRMFYIYMHKKSWE